MSHMIQSAIIAVSYKDETLAALGRAARVGVTIEQFAADG
jgi:hypothetical protein